MKLYAKTTSERASKGQGGNEYIKIELKDENKNIIVKMLFSKDLDFSGYALEIESLDEDLILMDYNNRTKSKKQKSEKCYCDDTELSAPHIH